MAHNQYNSYNLELEFKMYLENKEYGSATVKNYLMDLRNFISWSKTGYENIVNWEPLKNTLDELLLTDRLNLYFSSLRASKESIVTINRRMSSLRKFCSFCISQGWIEENYAKNVTNLNKTSSDKGFQEALIASFQKELDSQKISLSSQTNYLMDVREYIHITSLLTEHEK